MRVGVYIGGAISVRELSISPHCFGMKRFTIIVPLIYHGRDRTIPRTFLSDGRDITVPWIEGLNGVLAFTVNG